MSACFGTVAVALARNLIVEGLKYVGGSSQNRISMRYLTTPWIHIEVALAFQLGHPVLLLKEDLVYPEGVLEPLNATSLSLTFSLRRDGIVEIPQHILEALTSFREQVEAFADRPQGPNVHRRG